METLKKTVRAKVGHISDLSEADQALLQYAKEARKNAQAPYSHYYVGVAVRADNGEIFCGCNVERASWTQTTHAEQNAIDSMVAKLGPVKMKVLALVAAPEGQEANLCADDRSFDKIGAFELIPVPCGHCLQIIWENCFNDPNVKLISVRDGHVFLTTIGDALPMRFGPRELGVDYNKSKKA